MPLRRASREPSSRLQSRTCPTRTLGWGSLIVDGHSAHLPHKRIDNDAPWGIVSERVKLMVEPGRRQLVAPDGSHSFEFVGVPFGSHARLILLYLQTEALRTGSREVELGNSMRGWLARVGIPAGGMTGRSVRDQAERISRCKLTFDIATGSRSSGLVQQTIVDKALFIEADDGASQGRFSLETAKLSEGFFEQLRKHPVPLEEAAIKALSNNAPALDVYLWLAYRLHARLNIGWFPGQPSRRNSAPASRNYTILKTSFLARSRLRPLLKQSPRAQFGCAPEHLEQILRRIDAGAPRSSGIRRSCAGSGAGRRSHLVGEYLLRVVVPSAGVHRALQQPRYAYATPARTLCAARNLVGKIRSKSTSPSWARRIVSTENRFG